jgi:osomolarity two-component system response regulator SKN7
MPRLDGTNGADGKTSPATEGFNLREAGGSLGQRRTSQTLRVRRSTYVPGWAVPPKVLLVEDDAVCRKLSSKLLQVFGCEIDVAVDGMVALNKMNLDKYDLVLMVSTPAVPSAAASYSDVDSLPCA